MWKKDDDLNPAPGAPGSEKLPTSRDTARSTPATGERASIGRSITIRGEVSGEEDLLIQGHVDGSVNLKQQVVTVGREGQVKADITGRVVNVEGEVEGNLKAEEQVILRSSARVQGDITAPRVVLEDGANFRGGIDMGEPATQGNLPSVEPKVTEKKTPEPAQALSGLSKVASGSNTGTSDTVSKTGN